MRIVEDKALVVRTRKPHLITESIEKSAVIDKHGDIYEVAIKWGLREAEALATLRYKNVPSTILRDYNWPGPHKPFEHQKTTASFLTLHKRAYCFNEAGTGKTASVIWAADYLMKLGQVKRVLVLCPLSIMKSAWQQDLFKFAMHRSCSVAYGASKQRAKIVGEKAEFVIVNFDGLVVIKDEIKAGGFDLIVVDECFVAGTPVQTPKGPMPIETLREGDMVFTSNGVAPIKTLKRKVTTDIVEVRLSNGEHITCTGNHPFFTDVGWVAARDLGGRRVLSAASLSSMRSRVPSVEESMGVAPDEWHQRTASLLEILRTEEMAPDQSGEVLLHQHAAGETGEIHGVRAVFEDETAYIVEAESYGAQADGTGWERAWYDSCGTVDTTVSPGRVGVELLDSVGQTAARLSYELQAGLRGPEAEAGFGSGWWGPYRRFAQDAGQEEGSQTSGTWVESVSHLEHRGEETVYNLEVAGTPNFFVGGGWLVHNCTAYKSAQTRRWKVLREIATAVPRMWMLTGTPAAQSPLDAYGLAKMLFPQSVGHVGMFRDQVMYKITQFKWVAKPNAETTVHNLLQPAIRFEKKDCLDLPDVMHVEREAPLTPQQAKYYRKLASEMIISAEGEEVSAVNAATKLNKLLQIAGGAVYTDTHEVIEFDVSNRLKVVLEAIDETNNKALVFVPFTHTIQLLKETLEGAGITCGVINGDVSMNKRSALVEQFQKQPDPKVLIIQPQAASHGLTLTAADTVIWYAPVTSVETYLQANARIDRPGQKNSMRIVHIKGSPVESKLYQMLRDNIRVHERIIDLYREEVNKAA